MISALTFLLTIQASGAVVTGTVRSAESNQPIPNAIVELTDIGRATATDPDGRYIFSEVPAGPQHILVRYIGHAPRTLNALVPSSGQLEINVSLVLRPVLLPNVEVHSAIALRDLENDSTGAPDREVSIAAVRNDPLLAEPDGFNALSGGEVVLDPESPSGVHIHGGTGDQTGYMLDGIPVLNPYHAPGVFSAWNPDALSRLQLTSANPSPAGPEALSGVITAATLTPGYRLRAHGSLSTTQARVTLDGPLGGGIGYLVSFRSGPTDLVPRKDESSYLGGRSGDWLAKLELPALGGRLRLLGYGNQNQSDAAARSSSQIQPGPGRNEFEWDSRSLGLEWQRGFPGYSVRLAGWNAESGAQSDWSSQGGPISMTAARRDLGLQAQVDHRSSGALTSLGIRLERSHAAFDIVPDSANGPRSSRATRIVVGTLFVDQTRTLSHGLELGLGTGLALAGTAVRLGPHAQLRWSPVEALTFRASYSRRHQYSQSVRNAESVVGNIFPADLYLGAGAYGVPIARSDLGVIAVDYQAGSRVRVGLQAYRRYTDGLLLVAPTEGEPFTLGNFTTGSAAATGLSVTAAYSSPRVGLVASYGLQRVRFREGALTYAPSFGATHLLEAGVVVFPSATTSIKLGATGALGRRTTIVASGFEWEACNLRDKGCEFGGSPYYGGETPGGTPLPGYFRLDLGARKHWHFGLGSHRATIALFATMTNLLARNNVLTYTRDSSGEPVAIEMRPFSPLVVGIDWEF
ncbi:MAG TPA: carboxypeptidase-like regulatory domain-containing protein [Gemmatimonadales bacterium]|jgi:hypothetical protein|nr:carboxypeptidase-like regulatory domain-containing protein [Gemmatimonadales bacterium]